MRERGNIVSARQLNELLAENVCKILNNFTAHMLSELFIL